MNKKEALFQVVTGCCCSEGWGALWGQKKLGRPAAMDAQVNVARCTSLN